VADKVSDDLIGPAYVVTALIFVEKLNAAGSPRTNT
jgi:hypothetical protein